MKEAEFELIFANFLITIFLKNQNS